jgi:uncharacterized protein YjbI with pentapeptide repeats
MPGAVFVKAKLPYADLSHAVVDGADFRYADMSGAVVHGAAGESVRWENANLDGIRRTDRGLLEAERFRPLRPGKE